MAIDDQNRTAYFSRIETSMSDWKKRCTADVHNGLAIYCLKSMVRCFVIHIACNVFRFSMQRLCTAGLRMAEGCPDQVTVAYRWSSDLYKIVMDSALVAGYIASATIVTVDSRSSAAKITVFIAVSFAAYRLLEVFILSSMLSLDRSYSIKEPSRAIINTLWHYLEMALSFGVLYVGLTFYDASAIIRGDGRNLSENVLSALYFSIETLFTLGYGDYSPAGDSHLGMIMVVTELICGAFTVLVILQRITSSTFGASTQVTTAPVLDQSAEREIQSRGDKKI